MKVLIKGIGIVFGLFLPLILFAQGVGESPKPVYINQEGKIYVKSNLPLFLRLTSSTDENAQSFLLRSEASPKSGDALPFMFEGHGRHSIRHMADHRIPQKRQEDHLFYVFDDGKPPRVKISVSKAPWVTNGSTNIYGKPVTIVLTAIDEDSGAFGSFVAINSDPFTGYQQPIQLIQEQDYALKYYALDNVGNQSQERTRLYALDFTPPSSAHQVQGSFITINNELILSPKSKVTLESHDTKAGVKEIRYRFKGSKGVYDAKPLTMDGLKDGVHTLIYAAEDRVENTESNRTISFYLDSIPPTVTYTLLGDQYVKNKTVYVSGFTTAELTATDNKARVKQISYYFPNNEEKQYTSPFGFPKRNGKFEFSYAADDSVNNTSKKVSRTVVVDITPPKVSPKFTGEHYFSRKIHYVRLTTEIALQTTDNLSGIKSMGYAVDPASEADPGLVYDKPFRLPSEGSHSLMLEATDNVNNKTEKEKVELFVDEKAPEVYYHFSVNSTVPNENVYPLKTLLYLAATDKESGIRDIYYSINKEKETKYKNPLSFQIRTSYSVAIRAVDNVGNKSTNLVTFTIR